jgi:hypothetical protein
MLMPRRFKQWWRRLSAVALMTALAGAGWYVLGARAPARLALGIAAFGGLLVLLERLPHRRPWPMIRRLAIGVVLVAGDALIPVQRHGRAIEIVVGVLLLLAPVLGPSFAVDAGALFDRIYVAIGGEPHEPRPVLAPARPDATREPAQIDDALT